MKILYFHPHFTYPGGAGRFVIETARRIAARGHEVSVLCQSADENLISACKNVDFIFTGGPLPNKIEHWVKMPRFIKRLERECKKIEPDIFFPQVFPANYWGFLMKKKFPEVPCVWYCHEPSAFVHNRDIIDGLKGPIKYCAKASNPIMKIYDRKLVEYADYIISNSHFTARNVKNTYYRDSAVIYPGVDADQFKPVGDKSNFIFIISRLTKFKRIDTAIRLINKIDGFNLYIGGDGEEKNSLMALAHQLGVSDRVKFLGKISENQMSCFYSKARIVVFPSINEPFGLVPLEAMASKTPIIGMSSGGICETVLNGETGYLVNNEEELVERIKLLAGNDILNNQLSDNARKHVIENFSWERTSSELINKMETIAKLRK